MADSFSIGGAMLVVGLLGTIVLFALLVLIACDL
jgi:hypothetical protein